MRIALAKKLTKLAFYFLLFHLAGCSGPLERDFQEAQKNASLGNFRKAVQLFEQVILRDTSSPSAIQSMKEGARLSFLEIKDYARAAQFYQKIIKYSPDEADRTEAQKQLASLYFESLQDYDRAAVEYSKLATSSRLESEKAEHKLSVARSYYYIGNYFQTLSEITEILKLKSNQETEFHALLLNGNVFVAQKKFVEAAKIFQSLSDRFPEKSLLENVHLVLSLSFEESGDFKKALATLESIKEIYQPKEYLDLRIKRIQERAKNQPGAKGYRK